jgi:hypothetical protein
MRKAYASMSPKLCRKKLPNLARMAAPKSVATKKREGSSRNLKQKRSVWTVYESIGIVLKRFVGLSGAQRL